MKPCPSVVWLFSSLLWVSCANDTTGSGSASFEQISAGDIAACALSNTGGAWCWGRDVFGQLGNDTTVDSPVPVSVAGQHKFAAVGAGSGFACGLTTNRAAYCWGNNEVAQLGIGVFVGPQACSLQYCSKHPLPVTGGNVFDAIGVGGDFACGLTAAGSAYCWGWNALGQLGTGSTAGPEQCNVTPGSCSTAPIAVVGGFTFASLNVGFRSSCGLTSTGVAYCWGFGIDGQLGDSADTTSATPVPVAGGHTFTQLSVGTFSACGLIAGGHTYCWGDNTSNGLGDTSTTGPQQCAGLPCSTVPVPVVGGFVFTEVHTGYRFACGLVQSGAAYCWGANGIGQLGDSTNTPRATPAPVIGGLRFERLSTGTMSSCGLTADGTAYCWGQGTAGELGNGSKATSTYPVKVQWP